MKTVVSPDQPPRQTDTNQNASPLRKKYDNLQIAGKTQPI